jgi:hypothetical protein
VSKQRGKNRASISISQGKMRMRAQIILGISLSIMCGVARAQDASLGQISGNDLCAIVGDAWRASTDLKLKIDLESNPLRNEALRSQMLDVISQERAELKLLLSEKKDKSFSELTGQVSSFERAKPDVLYLFVKLDCPAAAPLSLWVRFKTGSLEGDSWAHESAYTALAPFQDTLTMLNEGDSVSVDGTFMRFENFGPEPIPKLETIFSVTVKKLEKR